MKNIFKQKLSDLNMSINQWEEIFHLIQKKKNNEIDLDWIDIIKKYNINISKDSLRKSNDGLFGGFMVSQYFYYLKNNSFENSTNEEFNKIDREINEYKSETSINKDGTYSSDKLIIIKENDLKDKTALLKAHGFDSKEWELLSARNNIWNVYSKQDGIQELYSSKIVVKPRNEIMSLDDVNEWFNKLDRNYSIPKLKNNKNYLIGNKCLIIDIADLHLNLQASMFVTKNEYNCDIAEKLFFYVINDILSRTSSYKFNKIIFCIGGDMLNSDNIIGTTTKGTPQTNDKHLFEAYEQLCAMTIKAIDLLKENCKVEVIYISGNHDATCGFKLAKYIDAWFRNEDGVNVDYSPFPRKYIKFGNTLFTFAHDGNIKNLPQIIADEAREYWSDIETTEVFLQHLHSEQVLLENYNMRIQRLPTISAKSDWAIEKGFGSKRQCKSFIFDLEDGLTDVLYTPIK